jgi:hypothetical protein
VMAREIQRVRPSFGIEREGAPARVEQHV